MNLEQNAMLLPPAEALDGVEAPPQGYVEHAGKQLPLYPRGDWSTGWPVLSALGTFWSTHFADRGRLLGLYRASSALLIQTYLDYIETSAALSRLDCPIYHRRRWYALVVRESQLNRGRRSMLKYDGTAVYDGYYAYGSTVGNPLHELELSALHSVSLLTNRLIDPSISWVRGLDFELDGGSLLLRDNPFTDGRFPVANVLDDTGALVDRETVLWAFDTQEDQEYLYQHYGYAIRYRARSTEAYRTLINGLWNGLVGGLTAADLEWVFSAVAGIPTVIEVEETVEAILRHPHKLVIVTDRHGYIYPAGSIATVTVGQRVRVHQSMVDTLQFFDLSDFNQAVRLLRSPRLTDDGQPVYAGSSGSVSSSSLIPATAEYLQHRSPSRVLSGLAEGQAPLLETLWLGRPLLGDGYAGPIGWPNVEGALDTSRTIDGRTAARLIPLRGVDEDIERFWTEAHTRGVASGRTWYERLGTPPPAYLNPAGFAIEHFLRNHGLLVYLRYARFGSEPMATETLKLLRDVLLPEKLLIVLVDYEQEESAQTAADSGLTVDDDSTLALSAEAAQVGGELSKAFVASIC